MPFEPLDAPSVDMLRGALQLCADDLMMTPPGGLSAAHVAALERLTEEMDTWPDVDVIGHELMRIAADLSAASVQLPDAIPASLRPLVVASLDLEAVELEREAGGDLDPGSAEGMAAARAEALSRQLTAQDACGSPTL